MAWDRGNTSHNGIRLDPTLSSQGRDQVEKKIIKRPKSVGIFGYADHFWRIAVLRTGRDSGCSNHNALDYWHRVLSDLFIPWGIHQKTSRFKWKKGALSLVFSIHPHVLLTLPKNCYLQQESLPPDVPQELIPKSG